MTVMEMILAFHTKFGVPVLSKPCIPHLRTALRLELIDEEFKELKEAVEVHDIINVADALADITYVVYGMAVEFGIPLDDVIAEVHRSNMTKVWEDGTIHRREDGKILKPPTYSPADINSVLYPK